ncbi:hypothetical protein [Mucilaginibacter litoreus]|uniref:hypothetical protein n=1 Tax=Mucilaginibacter litoreus TaxID=1048221 RepID=UPI003670648C
MNPAIIFQIGHFIKHDFSKEFPKLFTSQDFKETDENKGYRLREPNTVNDEWQMKYINLLEEYNRLLRNDYAGKIDNGRSGSKINKLQTRRRLGV